MVVAPVQFGYMLTFVGLARCCKSSRVSLLGAALCLDLLNSLLFYVF